MSELIGLWIAALLTVFILSFLYKDNPFYKFAEHLFVGVAAGYVLALSWHNTIKPNLVEPLFYQGEWILIVPMAFGLLLFTRFIPKMSWLSRWSLAAIVGIYSGLAVVAIAEADFVTQIRATLIPIWDQTKWTQFSNQPSIVHFIHLFTNFITIFGLLTILFYFFFSVEHSGTWGLIAKIGTGLLMVGFGAGYGYTVMTRIALLIDRVVFLLGDVIGLL
ncbi:MAG: hypothetical protein N2450_08435 [bacterium]|nr:hypothetical protein [bacterium]